MRHVYQIIMVAIMTSAVLARGAEQVDEGAAGPATPEALAEHVDLPSLIRVGLERSPRVKAARAEWRATIEEIPQAKSLPDPMVMVESRLGREEYAFEVSQSFPWPGTLNQAGRVAAERVRMRHAQYDQAIRDLIVDLKVSYQELLYLRGAMEITRQNQELLEHILRATTTRYADGRARLNDLLRAQSQVAQLGYDMILLRELEEVEMANLNALLALPSSQGYGKARSPRLEMVTLSIDELEQIALSNREELRAAAARESERAEGIRMAKLANRPMFTVTGMRMLNRESGMADEDPWRVEVGLTIPLWLDRNRSRVREAEYMHEAATQELRNMESETRGMVKGTYFRLENSRRLIELYEKSLIPQAQAAMEVAEQVSEGKEGDLSGFLETQGVWLNFNLARLRAVTDYQQYKARLERLLGGAVPAAVAPAAAERKP